LAASGTSGMVLGRLASVISGQVDGASDQLLVRAASMSPTGHRCEILSMRGLRDMGSSSGTLTRCGFPVEGSTIGTAAVRSLDMTLRSATAAVHTLPWPLGSEPLGDCVGERDVEVCPICAHP
jgi:hypothetical protein